MTPAATSSRIATKPMAAATPGALAPCPLRRGNVSGCPLYSLCRSSGGGCSSLTVSFSLHSDPPFPPPLLTPASTNNAGQLQFNEGVAIDFPPAVIGKGAGVPFVGGAPQRLYAPPLAGFEDELGKNQFDYSGGTFNCSFTAKCVPRALFGRACLPTPRSQAD